MKTVYITPQAWAYLEQYLQSLPNYNPGILNKTVDGKWCMEMGDMRFIREN